MSLLLSSWQEIMSEISSTKVHLFHGFFLTSLILILTICLEILCLDDVNKLLKKKGGQDLYKKAIIANFFNVWMFGSLTYWFNVSYLCHPGLTLVQQVRGSIGVIFVEGLLYYLLHRAFHEVTGFYWAHSFHHRFNDVILPSTASAVCMTEFSMAYMSPIIISCAIIPNDRASAVVGVVTISVTNLLIHTPFMVATTHKKKLRWFLVDADDHFRHHRKLTTNYAAPVISFDRIFGSDSK